MLVNAHLPDVTGYPKRVYFYLEKCINIYNLKVTTAKKTHVTSSLNVDWTTQEHVKYHTQPHTQDVSCEASVGHSPYLAATPGARDANGWKFNFMSPRRISPSDAARDLAKHGIQRVRWHSWQS